MTAGDAVDLTLEQRLQAGGMPVMQRNRSALVFQEEAGMPAGDGLQVLDQFGRQLLGRMHVNLTEGITPLHAVQPGGGPAAWCEQRIELGQGTAADQRDGAVTRHGGAV